VPIDHGEAPAAPRAIPHVHSGRRRGVQGARTASPSPVAAAFLPIPTALRLTGLGPFLFLCRLGPFRPKVPQSCPALFRAVFLQAVRSDSSGDFFYFYREALQLSEL
ncbi:hypothetical protein CRG98_049258, partial [Punica granatum]